VFSTGPLHVTQYNTYTIVSGQVKLATQTLEITVPGATDPDGDPITYSWSASNGSITGNSPRGSGVRVVTNYVAQAGDVTIIADDGKGGMASRTIHFN
jgi:hypothetical protein